MVSLKNYDIFGSLMCAKNVYCIQTPKCYESIEHMFHVGERSAIVESPEHSQPPGLSTSHHSQSQQPIVVLLSGHETFIAQDAARPCQAGKFVSYL